MTQSLTRDEIAVALRAIERALADRLTIVRVIVAPNADGSWPEVSDSTTRRVVRQYTVKMPRLKEDR